MPKTTVHVVDTMVTTPAHVAKASCGQAAELLGRHFTRAKAQYEKMVKLAKSQRNYGRLLRRDHFSNVRIEMIRSKPLQKRHHVLQLYQR